MIKATLGILMLLYSTLSAAGGDYVSASIKEIGGNAGEFSIIFEITENRQLQKGCSSFRVNVSHERVPWYSWLPFVYSSHPSYDQTASAFGYLFNSFKSKTDVLFGYMGGGLAPTKEKCVFLSKGLALESDGGLKIVLSFYTPV